MKDYVALFIISIGLRLAAFALIDIRFESDIFLFQFWASQMFHGGPANFYYADFFSDYPPLYMYVLWVIGAIRHNLGFEYLSPQFNLLVFTPAIISDVITVLLIYSLSKQYFSRRHAFLISFAYSVNPGVILNSSIWGQVDAIHTLLLFLALYAVSKKQTLPVYLLYGLAVLTKPQSLIVAPVFLYSAFYYYKEQNYSIKAALTMFGYAAATFLFMGLLSLPFGLQLVFEQYFATMGQRPFASINAYNFYALTGGIWYNITLFYAIVSFVAIIGVVCMTFWLLYRHWSGAAVFFTAALLYITTFVFSVRMNERYLFPALLFLLITAVLMQNKSDERLPILYVAFSATFFINCLDVLLKNNGIHLFALGQIASSAHRPIEGFIALISFLHVVLAIYTLKIGRDIRQWTEF